MTGVFIRNLDTGTEGGQRDWRQRWELCYHKTRNTWGDQRLEEARKDPTLDFSEGT